MCDKMCVILFYLCCYICKKSDVVYVGLWFWRKFEFISFIGLSFFFVVLGLELIELNVKIWVK